MSEPHYGSAAPVYRITKRIAGAFIARADSGRATLLVPVTEARPPLDRATGDIILTFSSDVNFELGAETFRASAAVIECANATLGNTFLVLADDVARAVSMPSGLPTPQDVSRALARWEELLRSKRVLSREDEMGLWGELWMMLHLPSASCAVAVWRGPDAEFVDFVGGGIGIECKASLRRLQHFVSQEQISRPLGDLAVYLQSIWVGQDLVSGQTVNDLLAEIEVRLDDRREFEQKLLATGYSRTDAHQYALKLRVLEPPTLFEANVIPRVRVSDAGVSDIRFLVSLTADAAVEPSAALGITMRLCGD